MIADGKRKAVRLVIARVSGVDQSLPIVRARVGCCCELTFSVLETPMLADWLVDVATHARHFSDALPVAEFRGRGTDRVSHRWTAEARRVAEGRRPRAA